VNDARFLRLVSLVYHAVLYFFPRRTTVIRARQPPTLIWFDSQLRPSLGAPDDDDTRTTHGFAASSGNHPVKAIQTCDVKNIAPLIRVLPSYQASSRGSGRHLVVTEPDLE
jgi:hypothetical protein